MEKRGNTYIKTLKDKNILVVGMGKSGKAAAKALREAGAAVSVQDSKPAGSLDTQFLQYAQNEGIKTYLGSIPEDMGAFDMLVLSPGVPVTLDFIEDARSRGAEITGEIEIAYRMGEGNFVAITGTNGKTTTTTLVGDIFEAAGRNTAVVGNIGNPVVTETVGSGKDDWFVAEVSSFQLETISEFRPHVSAILNLTPDHLNRHGTMEAYGQIKARIAENQTADDYLVVNADDEKVMALAADKAACHVYFSRKTEPDLGAYLDGEKMMLKAADGTKYHICDKSDLKIIGDHNVENVLAASAVCFFAGIDPKVISDTVKAFPGVEHRIEFCGNVDGVSYYNDSKGTNVDAAVIALKALKDNIILIAGGDGKSQSFDEMAKHLAGAVKALVLLGRDAPIIEECARSYGFTNIYNCKDMPDCVNKAAEIAEPGDKVLLSPACASWDMYSNFEQRGKHFKECVKGKLK